MFGLGVTEILVILAIALIFLGPKKLPALAKGLGKGLRNFQDALRGIENDIDGEPSSEKIAESEKIVEAEKKEENKNV